MNLQAKPIEWEQDDDIQWSEKNPVRWGFCIQFDDDETPPVYRAYWGENDGETCDTLEAAKEWCQKTANDFIADAAVVTPGKEQAG